MAELPRDVGRIESGGRTYLVQRDEKAGTAWAVGPLPDGPLAYLRPVEGTEVEAQKDEEAVRKVRVALEALRAPRHPG